MSNDLLNVPAYFHREYENDLPKQDTKTNDASQALRVVKVALPFVALYQPFGKVLAGGLGVARTFSTLSECISAKDYKQLSWALFNTCLAVGSVAGTIFLHPLGMLITTLNDIGMNIYHVYDAISHGEMIEAGKQSMRVANNTFYLAMLIIGSIELQLASLAVQVLVEGASSYEEFNKDNILETIGHLGMCMVRMNQSYTQLGMLQQKWKVESLSQTHAVKRLGTNNVPKPVESFAQKASGLEIVCATEGKWHPALGALKEQHKGHLVYAGLRVADDDEAYSFNDDMGFSLLPEVKAVGNSGDLVAVWVDADASLLSEDLLKDLDAARDHFAGLDKFLYISQYNASTGLWSVPNGHATGEITNWSLMSADPAGNALILLKNEKENVLEALTFNNIASKWSNPIELANHLPDVTAFDADALGNCTLVWSEKDILFAARSYDASTKTWNLPVLFKADMPCHSNEDSNLFVRRDLGGNIAVLAEAEYFQAEKVIFAYMFDGKTKQWSVPKLVELNREEQIVDLISMGKGQFTGIFAGEKVISSLLLDTNNCNTKWGSLHQIKSSSADIDEIIVDKDLFGNPVVAWKESWDEREMEEWFKLNFSEEDLNGEDLNVEDFGALLRVVMSKILETTKIHVANFDSSKGGWKSTEVTNGMIAHPKFGKVNGHLHLFWEDFFNPDFSYENLFSDEPIFPMNFNGMKWEETKGEWNSLGTIFQCSMKEVPFEIIERPEGYHYAKSIHDDGLHVIWKDGEEYRKKVTPLS